VPGDIQELSRAELAAWCADVGEPPYRAQQILAWVHRKGAESFDAMTSLSRTLRAKLAADFTIGRLVPAVVADASDGTRKLLFRRPGARPADGRGAFGCRRSRRRRRRARAGRS